jgi:hypothetical protein
MIAGLLKWEAARGAVSDLLLCEDWREYLTSALWSQESCLLEIAS